jgi:hypothetical protein
MSRATEPLHPRFWTWVFRFKGIWNCVVSVLFFFGEDSLRTWLGVPLPDPAYRAMFLALAFTFGLGYWRVSQDLTTNRDLIRGGVIGQTSVFVVLANEVFLAHRLPVPFLIPGLVDLLFAVMFVVFLLQTAAGMRTEKGLP